MFTKKVARDKYSILPLDHTNNYICNLNPANLSVLNYHTYRFYFKSLYSSFSIVSGLEIENIDYDNNKLYFVVTKGTCLIAYNLVTIISDNVFDLNNVSLQDNDILLSIIYLPDIDSNLFYSDTIMISSIVRNEQLLYDQGFILYRNAIITDAYQYTESQFYRLGSVTISNKEYVIRRGSETGDTTLVVGGTVLTDNVHLVGDIRISADNTITINNTITETRILTASEYTTGILTLNHNINKLYIDQIKIKVIYQDLNAISPDLTYGLDFNVTLPNIIAFNSNTLSMLRVNDQLKITYIRS